MLEGGIADKLGNEYEIRWALVEALRVLLGQADEIRLEPFNEHAKGLEFRITANGVDEWHQCKRRLSNGSWTIKALIDAGVLQAFAGKLVKPNTECVFVSSDPAPAFETLLEKARLAEIASDFYGDGGIGKGDRKELDVLSPVWGVDSDTLFYWLKRCRVEVTSDTSLMRRLEYMCGVLFRTPYRDVINGLIRFLTGNLGQRLTTDRLRQAVADLGIELRAQLDASLDAKFSYATDEYLASLSPKIGGIDLPVPGLDEIVRIAHDGEQPVTLVAGGAGSGKSVVLERIITAAREKGVPVLAFRIDRYLETQTLEDLGRQLLGHDSSPVAAFGSRFAAQPTLLVIDQVDAVSEASGRSGRMRDLFFEMVRQSHLFPHMRVVAACRSYDLDRDTRLEQLGKARLVHSLRLKPLDWSEAIRPLLEKLGIDEKSLTSRSRDVLTLPINLRLFVSIAEAGERADGELSSTRLFDHLLEIRERDLRQARVQWTALEAMGTIAQSMSDNQELTAPRAVLDRFPGAVDALSSAGLATAIGGKLQFVHESFFDHTFSRRFVTSQQTVHSILTQDAQRLFRRTQVRQIFSRLRDSGGRNYLSNLREVMGAADIRYLVKDAIAYWLSDVDNPTEAERVLVQAWFVSGSLQEKLARIVFNGRNWLPILMESGILGGLIRDGGDRKVLGLWILRKGAAAYSERVAEYLRNWWREDPTVHGRELVQWFERLYPDDSIEPLEALYGEVIAAIPASEMREDFWANFDLGSWVHKSGLRGTRILDLWLKTWMAAYPDLHPFGELNHSRNNYWVGKLAEKHPEDLLKAMVPAFAEAIRREQKAFDSGTLRYKTIRPPHYRHDQEDLRSVIKALETLAANAPDRVVPFLDMFGDWEDVGLFVNLRAISANGAGLAHRLLPLLSRDQIFKIGDGGGDWRQFANAAAAAAPYLGRLDRAKLEEAVLAYRPEYDWAREYLCRFKAGELFQIPPKPNEYIINQLNISGRDQRAILSTIGSDQLSPRAQARLNELNRKFEGQPLPDVYGIRGGNVRSPIAPEKAQLMTDLQWLSAMRKYDGDERHVYHQDWVFGGARELAMSLQLLVKEEPERFVALLERLTPDVCENYVEAVISGLRESGADGPLVARAIKSAMRWQAADFGRTICWTVQRHPSAALDPEILSIVMRIAAEGSASDTAVRTINPSKVERKREAARELLEGDGDLSSSGINGERGAAYEALSNILWEFESTFSPILDLLERRIEGEPLGSVRLCMAHVINAVGKYAPDRSMEMLRLLVKQDPRVVQGHAAQHTLGWAAHRFPDVVAQVSIDLQGSETPALRAHGHFLESLLALLDNERNASFIAGFEVSTLRRQIAGYRGAANLSSDSCGDRAAGWLFQLFNDSDRLVRQDTVDIEWGDVLDGDRDRSDLVSLFINSIAFDENSGRLMRALESRVSQFPALTFAAVDRVMELSGGWTDADRQGNYSTLYHLSRVLIELYRYAEIGSAYERKILDIFDNYLASDVHDIRDEIGAYERH